MPRRAESGDIPALCGLWEKVFGDREDYARKMMCEVAGVENVCLDDEDGKVAAMLTAIPVTMDGRPGAYFYAAATAPEYRRQGRMSRLLEYARQAQMRAGRGFAVLVPADEEKRAFYAKRGFEDTFRLRRVTREIKRNIWAVAQFDSITAARLEQLRRQYAPGAVTLPHEGMLAEIVQLYSAGATTVETAHGYGIYFEENGVLDFVELFARSDGDAERILEAARDRTGAERAVITVGAESELFLGEGRGQPYGMGWFWDEKPPLYGAYMRLMPE